MGYNILMYSETVISNPAEQLEAVSDPARDIYHFFIERYDSLGEKTARAMAMLFISSALATGCTTGEVGTVPVPDAVEACIQAYTPEQQSALRDSLQEYAVMHPGEPDRGFNAFLNNYCR